MYVDDRLLVCADHDDCRTDGELTFLQNVDSRHAGGDAHKGRIAVFIADALLVAVARRECTVHPGEGRLLFPSVTRTYTMPVFPSAWAVKRRRPASAATTRPSATRASRR